MTRISRHNLFMSIANLFAQRSTCNRAQVGVVIARNNRIIATGYNGAPKLMPHCIDTSCDLGPDGGCQRAVHAEANAIAFAACKGIPLDGSTLYTTHSPCYKCAQLIINAGIKEVLYDTLYRDPRGLSLLDEAGIQFQAYDPREP